MDANRFQDEFRPFRRGEIALARRERRDPDFLPAADRALLRTALRLAQISTVGREQDDLVERIGSFRLRLLQLLAPVLPTDPEALEPAALHERMPRIAHLLRRARQQVLDAELVSDDGLDAALGTKHLALVMGGAGGAGFVFLGALDAIEQAGLRPSYLLGASIGAILGALRARTHRFDLAGLLGEVHRLTASKLFRPPSPPGRYGLPGALRLDLKAGLDWFFTHGDGRPVRLSELHIPFDASVCGLGAGALTRDRADYAKLLGDELHDPEELTHLKSATVARAAGALIELAVSRRVFVPVLLGADPDTARLEVLDAVGFSAAIPALLHYDIFRDDPVAEAVLDRVFDEHNLIALVDGAIAELLPARRAWQALEGGRIGSRNYALVAMDALVAARGRNRLLLPLQRALAATVQRDRAFWDLYVPFERAPFVLDLAPRDALLRRAAADGAAACAETVDLLRPLLAPLPRWREIEEHLPEWER